MNLNPNQPDETIDEALLDEALSEETPEELEAKILALTDPQMLSLLNEAMAPEASDQLTDRILAATQSSMKPGTVPTAAPAHDTGALARIGPSTFRYAAAAAIALAAGLGFYFINPGPDSTDTSIAGNNDNPNVVEDDATATEPEWLTNEQFVSNDDYFESTTSPIEAVLEEAADSLEDVTITRDTLWAELDAYEQFLDNIES